MHRFHKLDNAAVILQSKGRFQQADVYVRAGELYAKQGASFIRINARGTSVPSILWTDIEAGEANEAIVQDKFGRLSLVDKRATLPNGAKVLALTHEGDN